MALGIDTKHMVERWMPDHENHLDDALGSPGRLQMWRVYTLATVIHDPSMMKRLSEARGRSLSGRKQAVLDWQPDQDDEQDEWEVFHHLHELCETSMSFPDKKFDSIFVARPLVTSAESSSFAARAQGQPPSSFRRYSIKISMLRNDRNEAYGMYLITHTDLQKLFPNVRHGSWCKWGYEPKIFCSNTRHKCAVFWQMQIDFVDLLSRSASSRLGKRRRTINPFLQVSSRCVDDGGHVLRAKRVSGVRHRRERRKAWVAEMKPPGSRNKVSFGDFKSVTEAARAVDAAFHYYGKTNRLNFADTPTILATRPAPAALGDEDKLRFVKEQAKWLASMASTLQPSSPPPSTPSPRGTSGVKSSVPEPPPRNCTANLPEISSWLSCGGCSDGLISQLDQQKTAIGPENAPQPWAQPQHNPKASTVPTNGVESRNPSGVISEGQSKNAIASPSDIVMSRRAALDSAMAANSDHGWSTPMHITEPWDSAEYSRPFFTPFGSLSEVDHSCEFQTDSPFPSPPAPMFDHIRSPYCDFQGGFPDRLMLEQQTLWHE